MPFSIALAGKGGTGKTTVAGMLIKYLVKTGNTPVLAVDADSNANLNEVLGLGPIVRQGQREPIPVLQEVLHFAASRLHAYAPKCQIALPISAL